MIYEQEIAVYKEGAVADGIQEASETADKYITDMTDGIMVHPENDTTSGWSIRQAIELFKSGVSYIKMWIDNNVPKIRVGKEDGGHVLIQSSGMDVYGGDGTKQLAHIGYDYGNPQTGSTQTLAPFYSLGERETSQGIGNYSVAEGKGTVATAFCSHAEGYESQAKGGEAHAEGYRTQATKSGAHSEGYSSSVLNILASGIGSHAEGYASYDYPTIASGIGSHAEGRETLAYGEGAHSEGYGTIAYSDHQHAQGKYNKEDTSGTYADIVGGGTSSARKNIEATTWTGDKRMKGDVYVGCNDDSTGGNKLSPAILSGIADSQGCCTMGDLLIEWGLASITTSSTGTTTGGLTQYLGTAQVTFTNTFAYKPNVLLTWSANYNNQSVLNTYDVTTTGFYAYGRTLTGSTTRTIRWIAIGQKA